MPRLVTRQSSCGSNGVPLRKLLTFATSRASGKPFENHWLLSGEVSPILRSVGDVSLPTHRSFMNTSIREFPNDRGIESLQKRLLSLRLVFVEYLIGHSSPAKDDWRTVERFWRVAEN